MLTISRGVIDFHAMRKVDKRENYAVNVYRIRDGRDGVAYDALQDLKTAMCEGNHDYSDISIDYFDVGRYVEIKIGDWGKPYVFIK